MHIFHSLGVGYNQEIIASHRFFSPKLISGQVLGLQVRSHCTIKYHDFFLQQFQIVLFG